MLHKHYFNSIGHKEPAAEVAEPPYRPFRKLRLGRSAKQLYKLVYDVTTGRTWAPWIGNNDEAHVGRPISYAE